MLIFQVEEECNTLRRQVEELRPKAEALEALRVSVGLQMAGERMGGNFADTMGGFIMAYVGRM